MAFRTQFCKHLVSSRSINVLEKCNSSSGISGFVRELSERALVSSSYPSDLTQNCSYLEKSLGEKIPGIYAGFDPTADSLHVGNLLIVVNLMRSMQFGCRPVALVGGATAAIGDPSGRDTERSDIELSQVAANAERLKLELECLGSRVCDMLQLPSSSVSIKDNHEWYKNMSAIDYLRICRPLRVGPMTRMGAVKKRLERDADGLSFTEFSYQTLQSYDWLHLSRTENCFFQLGGSDQLGHLDMGAHMIKKVSGANAGGICLPLVTDSAGNKLGKSTGASCWLSSEKTSPFHFYQFWKQLPDSEAEKFLPMYSLKPMEEVSSILSEHKAKLGLWIAQEALARELTLIVHGTEGLQKAEACTRALYRGSISDLAVLGRDEIISLFGGSLSVSVREAPTFRDLAVITRPDGKGALLMEKGAFKVNGVKRTDPSEVVTRSNVLLENSRDLTLICWGKRNFSLVQWIE